jgi:hypothetical protein
LFGHAIASRVTGMDESNLPEIVTTLDTESEPIWEPLEKLLPEPLLGCFMAMYQSTTNEGPVIHAYKHIDTRRYLFLDEEAGTWRFTGGPGRGSYCRIPLGAALEEAFCGWGDLVGYTAELGALVAEQIARARAPRETA